MRSHDPAGARYLIRILMKERILRYSIIRRYKLRVLNKQPRFRQW